MVALQGTNISPQKWHFEDDFPIPQVGYVNSLEGTFSCRHCLMRNLIHKKRSDLGKRWSEHLVLKFGEIAASIEFMINKLQV